MACNEHLEHSNESCRQSLKCHRAAASQEYAMFSETLSSRYIET